MSRTPVLSDPLPSRLSSRLSRRHLVPGGLLAGLALTGSAFSIGGSSDSAASSERPVHAVAQAVALPSPLADPAQARRASRAGARTAIAPVRYVRRDVAVGRTFSGYASWYGGSFHGKRTANGERFDTRDLTAASRTLAFGTRLRVCRQSQCVVVRINDRGPYVGGRVLDLSQAARDRLGSFGVSRVTATPISSRRVAVRPPHRPRPRPALPVRTTAAPVQPALATQSSSSPLTQDSADWRLAAGMLLAAGYCLVWLRRRRVV